MDRAKLRAAIDNGIIEWQRHAFEKMMERNISRDIVKEVLLSGEIIEDYPNDKPYPAALLLGRVKGEPFHVVAALDSENDRCFVITAYKPDLRHFEPDYKTRRSLDN